MTEINESIIMTNEILCVQNGYIDIPEDGEFNFTESHLRKLGTVFSNMAYYGYAPSAKAIMKLMKLKNKSFREFWSKLEPALKYISGDDRNMSDFVVYKNFPAEVLEMRESEYWFNQILMYAGLPNEWFIQNSDERGDLSEKIKFKILDVPPEDGLEDIYLKLKNTKARWSNFQQAQAEYLCKLTPEIRVDVDQFAFKENAISLIKNEIEDVLNDKRGIKISNATDVMRLAAAMSNAKISLPKDIKFAKFTRKERKFLLSLIERTEGIEYDFAMRRQLWKRLLRKLHPGDYKVPKVSAAYNKLYKNDINTIDSEIEYGIQNRVISVFDLLTKRPGQFARRLHKVYSVFGDVAFEEFDKVIHSLTVQQLLKLDLYLKNINNRKNLVYTPQGNWEKIQVVTNGKTKIKAKHLKKIRSRLSDEIGCRLNDIHPEGFDLDRKTNRIKIQSNGQELAPYGRGTEFKIPKNVKFLRSASFWKHKPENQGNSWFDNGWNFFDKNWEPKGVICWNDTKSIPDNGAEFSGDPTNSKDVDGNACQMIDLYPDKLVKSGIRYAVWSILCYSRIPFSNAKEVLGTLQWGKEAQEGNLYEPARAQMVFPITGNDLSRFIAYVDLVEKRLIYLDASLTNRVESADQNIDRLKDTMPAITEELTTLPSIFDLFKHGKQNKKNGIPILLNDKKVKLKGRSYVFDRKNPDNQINQIGIEDILNATGKKT